MVANHHREQRHREDSASPALASPPNVGLPNEVGGSPSRSCAADMNVRYIPAGREAPLTRAPSLSFNGNSISSLPIQTAMANCVVYPTIQAWAVSTWLLRNRP